MDRNNNRLSYSYRPSHSSLYTNNKPKKKKSHKFSKFVGLVIGLVFVSGIIYSLKSLGTTTVSVDNGNNNNQTQPSMLESKNVANTIAVNECSGNKLTRDVVVVIALRHLWACDKTKAVFNSAVVTGYDGNPSNITPIGTFHIYKKFTNVYLSGHDDLGSWDVHVNYWMPFLFNKYGAYGLHDATWRQPNAFGNIPQSSKNASHGCVELPLATAKWLYGWLSAGSTVTIKAT